MTYVSSKEIHGVRLEAYIVRTPDSNQYIVRSVWHMDKDITAIVSDDTKNLLIDDVRRRKGEL